MYVYSVYSDKATESGLEYKSTYYAIAPAKREMLRLMSLGYDDVRGSITRRYDNGDWTPYGFITLDNAEIPVVIESVNP